MNLLNPGEKIVTNEYKISIPIENIPEERILLESKLARSFGDLIVMDGRFREFTETLDGKEYKSFTIDIA